MAQPIAPTISHQRIQELVLVYGRLKFTSRNIWSVDILSACTVELA